MKASCIFKWAKDLTRDPSGENVQVANKHRTGCSASRVIQGSASQTHSEEPRHPSWDGETQETETGRSGRMWRDWDLCNCWQECKMVQFLKNLNVELPDDLLGIYPEELKTGT